MFEEGTAGTFYDIRDRLDYSDLQRLKVCRIGDRGREARPFLSVIVLLPIEILPREHSHRGPGRTARQTAATVGNRDVRGVADGRVSDACISLSVSG